jgi:hypothetical protein
VPTAALGLAASLAAACSVGVGSGEVTGQVSAPECGLEGEPFDLAPSFFAADPVEEILEIRVQRGSDFEDTSDGLLITVRDANQVKERLGEPLAIGAAGSNALVELSLYLNATCTDRFEAPPVFVGRAGTITFSSIYAPQVSESEVETAATFTNVQFDDGRDPGGRDMRNATLSGEFRFLFNRGRPIQRFP